jgi:hypothetical protein
MLGDAHRHLCISNSTFFVTISIYSVGMFCRVATGNPVVFTLSPPECYMEIRHGYGTSGTRVGGPVRVGDPLTLIIYMRSKYGERIVASLAVMILFSVCPPQLIISYLLTLLLLFNNLTFADVIIIN